MLNYQITCRNYDLTQDIKDYIVKKLSKHTKLIPSDAKFFVEINSSKDSKVKVVELKTQLKGSKVFINIKSEGEDILTLVDNTDLILKRKLLQIHTKHTKYTAKREAASDEPAYITDESYPISLSPAYKVNKKIYSDDRPMSVDEVIEIMEVKGFNAFLFKNFDNSKYCMLKKSQKGEYELIEPPV